MIRLNAPRRIRRIDVEGMEVRADLFDGCKVLRCARAGFEDAGFCGFGGAGEIWV
jgi:hypothetical protein